MGDLTNNPTAAQAFTRFGLGGRPDDVVPADPVAWLTAQITCADEAPVAGMPTLQHNLTVLYEGAMSPPGSAAQAAYGEELENLFNIDLQSALNYAVTTTIPFRERLVWFWSNHFAIMATLGSVQACAGPYMRCVIRPNMTATIADMLKAAIIHPAMFVGLDAHTSVGPQSEEAIAAAKSGTYLSFNENLARETMELYTLGVTGGYTQADVDALSYLITGINMNSIQGRKLGFFWDPNKAQPGSVTLLGRNYECTQTGLMAALHMLGTHASTYRHLATKLVTHFVSDTPEESDIQTVYEALAASGGSLPAAHLAIVGLQNAWTPLQKLRTPQDWMVAMFRAGNMSAHKLANIGTSLNGILTIFSQPLWQPQFPNGYSDLAADWTGPQTMLLRADCANWFSPLITNVTPRQAMHASVVPFLSTSTVALLDAIDSPTDELALLFCSSEFQRR